MRNFLFSICAGCAREKGKTRSRRGRSRSHLPKRDKVSAFHAAVFGSFAAFSSRESDYEDSFK